MSMYYNYDKLLSRDFLIALCIGERGVGKTTGAKIAMVKKFLKTGEQFIYMRRFKTELDTSLVTFWNDIQNIGYFEDVELKVKKSKLLTQFTCDREVCGYAVALSTSSILKSTAFPKVSTIIFDEFLIEEGRSYHYLKEEVNLFLDVIETVGRLRDNLKVILLGNNIGIHTSPYFAYWNLTLPYNSEFKTFHDGLIVVNYIKNLEYREAKKKSKFGRLIDQSDYGRFAIDNQVLNENDEFIGKKPPDAEFYGVVIINSLPLGMWSDDSGLMYLSEKYDPNTPFKFVFDYTDHTESTIFTAISENMYMAVLIRAYKQGWLRFENQKVKMNAVKLLNKCIR